MTLSALTAEIRRSEAVLARGSESALWAEYCDDMLARVGQLPYRDSDTDPIVPEDACEFWLAEYAAAIAERGEV